MEEFARGPCTSTGCGRLDQGVVSFIREMPKVELHVHLEGTVGPETLQLLAERNRIDLPPALTRAADRPRRFGSFDSFVRVFTATAACLRSLEDFRSLVVGLGRDMGRENIRYAEVTWTPQLHAHLGFGANDILAALNAGRQEVLERWGAEIRWIPDLVRSYPGPALRVQAWACSAEARDGGVVALGLGGPESDAPLDAEIVEAFARAAAAGLPANPHAGEGGGPQSVWATLKALRPRRIGHGVRSIEDEALVRHLADEEIVLEVCPTSNVALSVYPSYEEHPLIVLLSAGCRVTVNSDDPALFGSSLTGEYLRAVDACGLTLDQLQDAVLTAVRATYLSGQAKASMEAGFISAFSDLRVRHGLAPSSTAALSGSTERPA